MTPIDRLTRIERKRLALLTELAALDDAALAAHPRPGKWSIREIVEHLVLAEDDVVGDFSRLSALDAQPRGIGHHVRFVIVLLVLRSGIPVKAPSRSMLPTGERPLSEMIARWDTHQRQMQSFVAGLDRAGARRAIFRHPIAGPISVSQALLLLDAHLDSHIRQIRRLVQLHQAATAG